MHDLLVIGGGPAGASAAAWAARKGLDVVLVERCSMPRDKACGDALTPRAVHQLHELGLGDALGGFHQVRGVRVCGHRREVEMAWPEHPELPRHGYVARRAVLDALTIEHAARQGATVWAPAEGVVPLLRNGLLVGATVRDLASGSTEEVAARYVIVADGASSRFGRALGTTRDRTVPQGLAVRTYFATATTDAAWLEITVDLRDRSGTPLAGYGWAFPLGDGTVNVGVALLPTLPDQTSVNPTHLLEDHAARLAARWQLDPDAPLTPPAGGRLPMVGSVGPTAGPNWLIAGDAAGAMRPFNGDGLDAAYESGRLAADLVAESLGADDGLVLRRYPTELAARVTRSARAARLLARAMGHPPLARELTRVSMRSRPMLDWAMRVMSGGSDPKRSPHSS